MTSIIQAAGWPIWPLIIASIVALAIVIERSVALACSKGPAPAIGGRCIDGLEQGRSGRCRKSLRRVRARLHTGGRAVARAQ